MTSHMIIIQSANQRKPIFSKLSQIVLNSSTVSNVNFDSPPNSSTHVFYNKKYYIPIINDHITLRRFEKSTHDLQLLATAIYIIILCNII